MNFQHKKLDICGQQTDFYGYSWDPFYTSLSNTWDGNRSLQNYLSEHVDDGASIIDVGANIGTTTIMMSRTIPGARIIAIEPTPAGFACIEQNILANKIPNIRLVQAAAGERIGSTLFHQSEYIAGSHMVTEDHPTIHEEAHAIRVPITTIDDVVAQYELDRVDFIKVDVEGFEPAVMRGAEKTIAQFQPVFFIEFNAFTIAAYGDGNPRAFLNYLRATFPALAYDRGDERILIRTDMDALGFLNYNMTQAGCVSDLICANDRNRVVNLRVPRPSVQHVVLPDPETFESLRRTAAAHEAEQRRADEFENSLSWRVTAPLRKLRKLLS